MKVLQERARRPRPEDGRHDNVDFLIIGSGIAGLFTALAAQRYGRVLTVTKSKLAESNTRYAQGGIAAATGPDDTPRRHFDDTLVAGAGLCDEPAVRVLTDDAPDRIRDLIRYGVEFDRENGDLARCLEGAHTVARVLHAGGDATGGRIAIALADRVRESDVAVLEDAFVRDLVVEDGVCVGARVLHNGETREIRAQHVVLATGGAGQLFRFTTNPAVATGDGLALAERAGAALADLEFFQFHPTALSLPGAPTFLISEAVRGEGGVLRNPDGERFMPGYDPRAELAPRDVVSRAILAELRRYPGHDHVWLDVTHLPADRVRERFPSIVAFCAEYGLDVTTSWIPVRPAAHYLMGGVRTNTWGETTIPGLYACGEVACTGVHGANRLASNSLLEGIVFGDRVVRAAIRRQHGAAWPAEPVLGADDVAAVDLPVAAVEAPPLTREALQQLMWDDVGIERNEESLERARSVLAAWEARLPAPVRPAEHELANMVRLGRLMATAALERRESRGGHFRIDFPVPAGEWHHRIVFERDAVRPGAGTWPAAVTA